MLGFIFHDLVKNLRFGIRRLAADDDAPSQAAIDEDTGHILHPDKFVCFWFRRVVYDKVVSRLRIHQCAGNAQWEREEITERVNASVLTRAKLGKSINGSAPYGYQWKDRKLVIQPIEAPIRRKAYELFLQHRRKGVVANLLNAAGYRTRGNCPWRDSQVYRILTDPSAKGIYYFNRLRQIGEWKTELKPESEWGKVSCEPIVAESLWNQVNQIIEEHLKSYKRPGKLPVQLFGSLAHCTCGHKMYVRAKSPKYVCRKCHNKIPMTDLEAIFHEELKAFFAEPQRIAE